MEITMTTLVMLIVAIIAVIMLIAVLANQTQGNTNLIQSLFSSFSKGGLPG